MSPLDLKDHAEAIALFRSEIVGALTRRELDRGDLAHALSELSQQRFRPPLSKSTKAYSIAMLERLPQQCGHVTSTRSTQQPTNRSEVEVASAGRTPVSRLVSGAWSTFLKVSCR